MHACLISVRILLHFESKLAVSLYMLAVSLSKFDICCSKCILNLLQAMLVYHARHHFTPMSS